MKVSKKSKVAACEAIQDTASFESPVGDMFNNKQVAAEKVMDAINVLSEIAATDELAKDAIADLSVIYFELK